MIDFIKYKTVYFALSSICLVIGITALILWGLKPAVDFTGGSLLQIRLPRENETQALENIFREKDVKTISVAKSGQDSVLVRTPPLTPDAVADLKKSVAKIGTGAAIIREETVGPTVGRELLVKTLIAVALASLTIVIYVALRFKSLKYGVCAVLAMFHDTGILLGSFAVLGHLWGVEVDLLFVTAVLTLLSFSVHDTIVVFDRIREASRRNKHRSFPQLVNKAINETLIRSLNNSLTIIFMLLALLLLGGENIKWFIAALLIGTISGTYSSTFTAAPLLVVWDNLVSRRSR
jgi:preprotein translocase subunit SecF